MHPSPRRTPVARLLAACFAAFLPLASAAPPPPDHRLAPPQTLNGDFPFSPPPSLQAWEQRAAHLRLHTQVALGLFPFPEHSPLHPVIHGRQTFDTYSIEKVFFQALPGFFVTGNLYRPLGLPGPHPAGPCPHGQWPNGRFMQASDPEVAQQLASRAERDPAAARSPLQARCVHLARMGCTVFHYDMIGYADSIQLSQALAHQFKSQRPAPADPALYSLFSAPAESRLHSILSLQTWSSIRALDFLASLPEVDPARIGVTGASGGASQAFLLAAIDARPAALFPAVMVSTSMQGGCTCENASLLRVGTNNVELAALFAPKPAHYTAADDWTKNFASSGFPQLQEIYRLHGAPDQVSLLSRTEFPHNYNLPSRLAMYQWMAQHLHTPRPAPTAESPFTLLSPADLSVWDSAHPAPTPADPAFEQNLLRQQDQTAARQIAAQPQLIDQALPFLLGRSFADAAARPFSWSPEPATSLPNGTKRIPGTLAHGHPSESLRCLFLYPSPWSGHLLIHLGPENPQDPRVQQALASGSAIAFPSLFADPAAPPNQIRRVPQDRDFLGYTDGYNHPPLARRAHDLMALLAWLQQHQPQPSRIDLIATPELVPETALALTQIPPGLVTEAHLPPTPFRFANLTNPFDPALLPGAVKYGDLPALLQRVRALHLIRD